MQGRIQRDGFEIEAERARRYDAHLSVLLINVVGLEDLKEQGGVAAAESLLAQVAERVRENIRKIDVFGRWDRDDFVILTVDRNADGCLALAEKLRCLVSEHEFDWAGHPRRVSVCIGVARGVPEDEAQIDRLIDAARAAVGRARATGPDRVEFQAG